MKKRWIPALAVFACLTSVLFLSKRPFEYDIWFHLKSGEIIAKMGLIRYDVFSQAAGRQWYPYEWLFQLLVYWVQTIGGLPLVTYFIAALVVGTVGLFFLIARTIYRLPPGEMIAAGVIFYGLTYYFYVSRPLTLVYLLFFLTIFILLLYIKRQKNYLWLLVPVTIIWTNIHGSMFFPAALCAAYGVISYLMWMQTKNEHRKKQAKILGVWVSVLLAITVLPPVGITQYRLLYLFWVKRFLIQFYILEWQPIYKMITDFWYYTGSAILVSLLLLYTVFRQKKTEVLIWLLPFLPFVITPYIAVRNAFFGYSALSFMGLELLAATKPQRPTLTYRIAFWGVMGLLCVGSVMLIISRRNTAELPRPDRVVSFIQKENIQGPMYNEFGIGGYLLYHLYPRIKVFFDGRADVYICCEIPDDLLLNNISIPASEYQKIVDMLMDKYHIAFALIGTGTNIVRREVAITLFGEPAWHLVYFDDTYSLFIRDNTGNDAVIRAWGASAATPLGTQPYQPGRKQEARTEYERMLTVADSATARNALATMDYEDGAIDKAKEELQKAITANPKFDATYVSLAAIAIEERQFEKAREYLNTALSYDNKRGLTYILLSQLEANFLGDAGRARDALTQGLHNVRDIPSRDQLQELLKSLE